MIFTRTQESNEHGIILVFPDSDSAWSAHSVLCDAYPYYLQPNVVCCGGYENALEMFTFFPAFQTSEIMVKEAF